MSSPRPPEPAPRSDGELLQRFLDSRDQPALTELVTRHAAVVRGVCQRLLGNSPDADDAFQATFLVLVRSGERIRRPQSLAAWLYGVAHRIARRQRHQRSRALAVVKEADAMIVPDPLAELATRHDVALFDAELARLPEKYRAPIVLHHLEGKSQREVAAELKLTEGAVDGLLKRGRNELRLRLARQGVIFGVTVAVLEASQRAVLASTSQPLIDSAVQGVMSLDPVMNPNLPRTPSARLAQQEMTTMALFQTTKVAAWTVAATLFIGAAGVGISTARHEMSLGAVGLIASELEQTDVTGQLAFAVVAEANEEPTAAKAAAASSPQAEAEDRIFQALDEITDVSYRDSALKDAMKYISDLHQFRVIIPEEQLAKDGISPALTINLEQKDVSLRSVLKLMLEPHGLDYIVRNGELQITTHEAAEEHRKQRSKVAAEAPNPAAAVANKSAPAHFRKPLPTEERIHKAFQQQTEISFVDSTLRDALDYIEDLHKFDIIVSDGEIADEGLQSEVTINLELSGVQLKSALNRMLEPHQLDYVIKDEVMMITTREKAAEYLELRVYDAHDLEALIGKPDEGTTIESIIKEAVGGEWQSDGGRGTMHKTAAGLVVRHNQRMHAEIENFLEQLRRAAAAEKK